MKQELMAACDCNFDSRGQKLHIQQIKSNFMYLPKVAQVGFQVNIRIVTCTTYRVKMILKFEKDIF